MQYSLGSFRPKFLNDLIRVGCAGDGGYVINGRSVRASQYLLSFGVDGDWTFELEFMKRKPGVRVFCFDPVELRKVFVNQVLAALKDTLSLKLLSEVLSLNFQGARHKLGVLRQEIKVYLDFSSFFGRENVRLCSKGISGGRSEGFLTLDEAFRMMSPKGLVENCVFVKMDIEGSEYQVLPYLPKVEQYVNGMVVEFHDLGAHWAAFVEIMNEIKVNFEITHIHGNNYAGLIPNSNTPKILEVTFVKKTLVQEERPAREAVAYPIPELDHPNDPCRRDYPLDF